MLLHGVISRIRIAAMTEGSSGFSIPLNQIPQLGLGPDIKGEAHVRSRMALPKNLLENGHSLP